jgi:hypothetical protein
MVGSLPSQSALRVSGQRGEANFLPRNQLPTAQTTALNTPILIETLLSRAFVLISTQNVSKYVWYASILRTKLIRL